MGRFVFGLLLAAAVAIPAQAQLDHAPKVQARLIAEHDEVAPGATLTVALEENIRPQWHTYWRNPGDAGAPTEIKWTLPDGWQAGSIQWPYPKELPVGPLMDYGYEGKLWLLSDLKLPADAQPGVTVIRAVVSWLVCKEVCIPEDTALSLPLVVGPQTAPANALVAAQFAAARAKLPAPSPWPARFSVGRNGIDIFLASKELQAAHIVAARFFPFEDGLIKGSAPQNVGRAQGGLVLRVAPGKHLHALAALGGVVVLTSADASVQALEVDARPGIVPPADFPRTSELTLPLALFFAFIGGLILNLMPCVLPILAMKALAVASHAGRPDSEAAREGFAYGIGAVVSFAALGMAVVLLRAGGAAVGWGFQLQEPEVVAVFALLMFAVGLNLSGVFDVPGLGVGEALARRGGTLGAFFTGVLAVAVAAPCTAPFMAAALGFALTQTSAAALAVFVALGFGFAAPFVALALWPRLLRLLPKPGGWMVTFRQMLAFPMYATALWLAWVLGMQSGLDGVALLLFAALIFAFGLWALGASRNLRRWAAVTGWTVLTIAAAAVIVLVSKLEPAPAATGPLVSGGIPAERYTPARLQLLRAAHRPIFVNATAAWCVTCLVNEKVALEDQRVRAGFAAGHIAYLVADWTRRDPDVTAFLASFGREGVPLYVYYPAGGNEPKVLPQILTPHAILDTLRVP